MSEELRAITRYDPDWDKDMVEAEGGDWVRFEDHENVVRELAEALRLIAETEPPSATWAGDLGIRAIRAHARAALAKIAQERRP